jgi:glutamyl-tRNA(Gln) amidotransferase subunit E
VANLQDHHYRDALALVAGGKVAKEGLPQLLRVLADHPERSASAAAEAVGLGGVEAAEVTALVRDIVRSRADLVRSRGDRSIGPLMGLVMKELRGKVDGALISAILKKEIQDILNK